VAKGIAEARALRARLDQGMAAGRPGAADDALMGEITRFSISTVCDKRELFWPRRVINFRISEILRILGGYVVGAHDHRRRKEFNSAAHRRRHAELSSGNAPPQLPWGAVCATPLWQSMHVMPLFAIEECESAAIGGCLASAIALGVWQLRHWRSRLLSAPPKFLCKLQSMSLVLRRRVELAAEVTVELGDGANVTPQTRQESRRHMTVAAARPDANSLR